MFVITHLMRYIDMILTFNGTAVTPDPCAMTITYMDISSSDSGRSPNNAMMHKVVLAQKRKIHLEWWNISREEANTIYLLLRSGTNKAYVTVEYDGGLQPGANGLKTGTFYYGDISTALQQVWVSSRKCYSSFAFDLIEV